MDFKFFNFTLNKSFFRIYICISTIIVLLLFAFLLTKQINKLISPKNTTTITISAIGDCTLGKNILINYHNSWNYKFDNKGKEYFLKNVSSIFKNDDLSIANLEGVLSNSQVKQEKFFIEKNNKIRSKTIFHQGRPEYIEALTSGGIDVVTFANNHNIDFGIQGFEDTIETCKNYNLPIAYYDNVVRYKVKDLTIGIISVDATYNSLTTAKHYLKKGIANLHKDCDLIIASIHWGKNYQKHPNKTQRTLGRLSIDYGADFVIGHHPHILQGVERYKGRFIFYSLGNFTYGGRSVPKDIDTIIAQKTFTFIDKKLQIDDNVKIIPCWMSTKKEINDFSPIVKDGKIKHAIIDKINTLSAEFSVFFDNDGKPVLPKAKNTFRIPVIKLGKSEISNKIPEIIYQLLDIKN